MTLTEFLSSIKKESQTRRVLATVLFLEVVQGTHSVKSAEVKEALLSARVSGAKKWDISAAFRNAGAYVESIDSDENSRKLWRLTDTGREFVRTYATLPPPTAQASAHLSDVEQIRQTVLAIPNQDAKAYAEEAVQCLAISAHRAAIVFMWVAAVHEVQERIWAASNPTDITSAALKHSPKAKVAKKRDDLIEYNELLLLQIAHSIGVLDKNEKSELGKCLDLRNACGHPNKYRPGVHKAKAHIEDIVTILFK